MEPPLESRVTVASFRGAFLCNFQANFFAFKELADELPSVLPELSAVPVIQVSGAHGAMLAATHPVPIARDPTVQSVGERTHERDLEQPCE
jgi:hypothetical protein